MASCKTGVMDQRAGSWTACPAGEKSASRAAPSDRPHDRPRTVGGATGPTDRSRGCRMCPRRQRRKRWAGCRQGSIPPRRAPSARRATPAAAGCATSASATRSAAGRPELHQAPRNESMAWCRSPTTAGQIRPHRPRHPEGTARRHPDRSGTAVPNRSLPEKNTKLAIQARGPILTRVAGCSGEASAGGAGRTGIETGPLRRTGVRGRGQAMRRRALLKSRREAGPAGGC